MSTLTITELSRLVRAYRHHAGLTQEELARRAGISRPTLVALERSHPGVAVGTVLSVLTALGCPLTVGAPASVAAAGVSEALPTSTDDARSDGRAPGPAVPDDGDLTARIFRRTP